MGLLTCTHWCDRKSLTSESAALFTAACLVGVSDLLSDLLPFFWNFHVDGTGLLTQSSKRGRKSGHAERF